MNLDDLIAASRAARAESARGYRDDGVRFELPAPTVQPGWGRRATLAQALKTEFPELDVSLSTSVGQIAAVIEAELAAASAPAVGTLSSIRKAIANGEDPRDFLPPGGAMADYAVEIDALPDWGQARFEYRQWIAAQIAVAAPAPALPEWCCGGTCLRAVCEFHSPEAIAKAAAKDAPAAQPQARTAAIWDAWLKRHYADGGP